MKRRFTILTAAFALIALLALPMGMRGQTRAEEVYSTCLFGSDYNSNGVGSYTATWSTTNGEFTWTIVNGNNNNNAWNHVRFGRKNNASVGQIKTTDAYGQAITKVDLTIDAITASNVNSIKLYTGSDGETWSEAGSFTKATGVQTVTLASPATNLYYKIEFDCASGSANGFVQVPKVEYYYNTSGANSPTITAQDVEIAYNATSGAIEYTINNPATNGQLTATTTSDWLTLGSVGGTILFTCTANTGALRTATVTLTYTYGSDNVTKNVTVTQAANPNGPGSQANPYTVAQARAAIDAGSGITGVYATGIVSSIVSAYSSQYSNISFNFSDDGETSSDQLEAFRCVSTNGADASTVAVGDIVTVYGDLTLYNNTTYEFTQGCQLVSLTHSGSFVETPVINPNGGTFTEAQTVTITCATEGTTIYYTTDGSEPDDESIEYEGSITVDHTMTIKAKAYDTQDHESAVATATFTINLPYSGAAYARVDNVSYLTDGVKVILAARYDTEHSMGYYAMPNTTSGQLDGVLFTATTSNGFEVLPATILDAENSYYWTVNITNNGYTFTNTNGNVLGWTSGTSFVTGGDNTIWTIEEGTTGSDAMVPNYTAFRITNVGSTSTSTTRAIAMNGNHKFGPFAISNNNGSTYNFSIDIFVQGAEPAVTPSIVANDVEIAYDATSGTITYTINNPAGGVLTASTTSDWLTIGAIGETVSFTCTANTGVSRTATVTLTYTYNRATVNTEVTVTQAANPNMVNNISEITEVGSSYTVRGTVVAINSRGFIMGDGTGYVYIYLNAAPTVAVGDIVTVSGTTATYGHIIQFNNTATINEATSSNYNGTPAATVITEVPDYTEGYHLSDYLVYEGTLTKSSSSYFITLGEAQIQISYPTTEQGTELTALNGKTVHVKGYFTGINSSSKFTTMLESVEEVISTDPVINANDITLAYDATSGEIAYTITNPVTGTVLNATTAAEWISNIAVSDSLVTFNVTENEGEQDRTATITLTYAGAQNKEVTVTQGHFILDYAVLPFIWEGGTKAAFLNENGTSVHGVSDYGENQGIYRMKLDDTNDYILVKTDSQPGIVTIGVKMIGGSSTSTIFVQGSTDGETFDEGEGLEIIGSQNDTVNLVSTRAFGESVRYVRLYFHKGSNVGVGPITIAKPSTDPAITVNPAAVNVTAEGGNGTLEVTYQNIDQIVASVYFCDAEGVAATYNWITANMNNGNNVAYTINANDGAARTAYLKVKVGDTYSNLVTITQTEYVPTPTGSDFVRISSLDQLTDGSFVVIASRYDTIATNYFAMKNTLNNGKAQSTAFVSTTSNGNEILSTDIVDGINSYYWVVSETEDGYTFTNANGDVLSYNSSSSFNMNGSNTTWNIESGTSGAALVHYYNGFKITNVNTNNRCIAFRGDTEVFGPYSTQNINDDNYNFFLDIFVETAVPQTVTQTTALATGVNWFSTYLEIELDDLKAALREALPNATSGSIVIKSQNNGQCAWLRGNIWSGQLKTMDVAQMYKIVVPADCEITLEGMLIDPAAHPITISANSNNWIGFPFSESMTITNAFAGLPPTRSDGLKSAADGQANYVGRWTGALKNLEPGKGYIYQSKATEDKTFVYPTSKVATKVMP